jgi:hypothetical protein
MFITKAVSVAGRCELNLTAPRLSLQLLFADALCRDKLPRRVEFPQGLSELQVLQDKHRRTR